jgi:hypothetical protein
MYSRELLIWAGKELGCEPAAVAAVAEVESGGGGFNPDGTCKILFEAHLFDKFTHGKYRESHPTISCPTWAEARKYYKGGEREWDRFSVAAGLDIRSAIMSASWGAFQILGANYKACGYPSPDVFAASMSDNGEEEHLRAVVKLIKYNRWDRYLRLPSWEQFAAAYNGPGYKTNRYDSKLKLAYYRHRDELKKTTKENV